MRVREIIAEKLTTIAENQERVFEAGKQDVVNQLKEAQKGMASGEIIGITDISPIEHNLGVKVSDANATLKVQGKNLKDTIRFGANSSYANTTNGFGTTVSTNKPTKEIVFTQSKASADESYLAHYNNGDMFADIFLNNIPANTPLVFSFDLEVTNDILKVGKISCRVNSGDLKTITFVNGGRNAFVIDKWTETDRARGLDIRITGLSGKMSNFQLEVGDSATSYEPYIEPTSYTPNADGTVDGVKGIYPNTTLLTDTSGVLIECEYIKDLNAAVGEITDAILSIGGMLDV